MALQTISRNAHGISNLQKAKELLQLTKAKTQAKADLQEYFSDINSLTDASLAYLGSHSIPEGKTLEEAIDLAQDSSTVFLIMRGALRDAMSKLGVVEYIDTLNERARYGYKRPEGGSQKQNSILFSEMSSSNDLYNRGLKDLVKFKKQLKQVNEELTNCNSSYQI